MAEDIIRAVEATPAAVRPAVAVPAAVEAAAAAADGQKRSEESEDWMIELLIGILVIAAVIGVPVYVASRMSSESGSRWFGSGRRGNGGPDRDFRGPFGS
ncbi:hypothetical protein P0W64_06320 [Tsukamurella sp. 8F]|uniref:hypothetical protein n=1 Tax=unclassified Tsukamurella TaxID=2633480 RepID=UPI0023B98ED1|nr:MULTISPECIES: hypothetical protein [unclassified Tsukamurella]MDF0530067.1 hypothetical protein [Tsukamurella sp. 8J]MDF0586385.1 hypothetical protein [Tsukamurella sp. 8F]